MGELETEGSAAKTDMEAKYGAFFESDLKEVYQKAFDRHDTNKNGTIEAGEAEGLFENFASVMAGTFAGTFAAFAPAIAAEAGAPEEKVKEQIEPTIAAL